MKKHTRVLLLLLLSLLSLHAENAEHTPEGSATPKNTQEPVPLAPEIYRRPENYQPRKYPFSLNELRERFSDEMMKKAARVYAEVCKVNEEGPWKPTAESIDRHKAPEWFLDAKFGMFIDWGPWSIAGWAPKLKETSAMYPDWYELRMDSVPLFREYHEKNWGKDFKRDDFIPLFQAREYQPEKLAEIAKEAGMKYVVPFAKHHGGYCLWPSSYTRRNTVEMGPGKDLIAPLAESCKKNGLKFGFYFSVDEWEYPLIGPDNKIRPRLWMYREALPLEEMEHRATGKIAVRDFAKDYLVPQAAEFIDRYDPDLIWYDGQWSHGVGNSKTYEISSYFYNKALGRKEVAVNDRYGIENGKDLRRIRGDYFTSEYHDLKRFKGDANGYHPWEECRGISQSFGFNWQDTEKNVIGSKEFLSMFLDIVSRGGNLLLIVNLDGQGALPEIQKKRLEEIGRWLAVNGEGIYGTRMYSTPSEGDVLYTRSKDNTKVYAFCKEWPGRQLVLKNVKSIPNGTITMLGVDKPLVWRQDADKLTIDIPEELQDPKTRPCEHAWAFRIPTAPQESL